MRFLLGFYFVMYIIFSLIERNNIEPAISIFHQNAPLPSVTYHMQGNEPLPENNIKKNQIRKHKKKKAKEHDKSYTSDEKSLWSINDDVDWAQLRKEREKVMQDLLDRKKTRNKSSTIQGAFVGIEAATKTASLNPFSAEADNFSYLKSPSTSTVYSPSTSDTYSVNGTEYYVNETYSTTGKPKVKRNMAVRNQYLKSKGYSEVPDGYEVDHIVPLSQGGSDTPGNMQLLTVEEHRVKTARERSNASHTSYTPTYNSTLSTPSLYNTPSTTQPNSTREIQTGPRGGQYYINSNGNKTYTKSH